MFNIEALKNAIISTNKLLLSASEKSKNYLYDSNGKSYKLTERAIFLDYWYGTDLYKNVIQKIINDNLEEKSYVLGTIVNSYKKKDNKKSNRDTLYKYIRRYYHKDDLHIEQTINDLAFHIKTIVENNCYYYGKTHPKDLTDYAQFVWNTFYSTIQDMDDNITDRAKTSMKNRTSLFDMTVFPATAEYCYTRLAALSFILLIPNDPTKDQELCVNKFSAVFNQTFTSLFSQKKSAQNSDNDSIVGKELIRSAWQLWYLNLKKEGNVFSKLFSDYGINQEILPLVNSLEINAHRKDGLDQPLLNLIADTTSNLLIKGEGGIGKTTALYSIMENAYSKQTDNSSGIIPMYIELSLANTEDIKNNTSSYYIRNMIYNQIESEIKRKQGSSSIKKSELKEAIENQLCLETDAPEYLLLLDGLNEVSRESIGDSRTIIQMIYAEIIYIIKNYCNVRVIITSRHKDNLGTDIDTLYLSGITYEDTKKYLKCKISEDRLNQTLKNKQLMDILRIPLFLTMYARIDGNEKLLSRGEILHEFFVQKKGDLYSERSRIQTIENKLKEQGVVRSDASITSEMLGFLLDFIMPEIAWHMVKGNAFHISRKELVSIISNILDIKNVSVYSWCGTYGKEYFKEQSLYKSTSKIANQILKAFEDDDIWSDTTDKICECLTEQLGVLVSNNDDQYSVVHQHIRDYFAALYHINKLQIATYMFENIADSGVLARECLSEWKANPLPSPLLTLIGEVAGELHNTPHNNCGNNIKDSWNIVSRGFDIFRNRFDDKDGYSVWNLLQILKLVRKDLSGADLSSLDLTNCRINGYRLANKEMTASLEGSKINDLFFKASGHREHINSARISQDGKYIITASDDGSVIIWNTTTFEEFTTLNGHNNKVRYADFSNDANYVITASKDCTAKIWELNHNTHSYEEVDILDEHTASVNMAEFSNDGKYILTASDDGTAKVWGWNGKTHTVIANLIEHKDCVNSAHFSNDGNYIITASNDKTAKVWEKDPNTNVFVEIKGMRIKHTGSITSATFSSDRMYIVTASKDKTAQVWKFNAEEEAYNKIPNGKLNHSGSVNSAEFSPDDKFVITSSSDKTVRIWSVQTGEEIRSIKDDNHDFWRATYSYDGKYILTTTWRETKLWDVGTYSEVPGGVLKACFSDMFSATYSPDGDRIVIACRDGSVQIWGKDKTNIYKEIQEGNLKGHKHSVYFAQYSPSGKYIITASGDGTVKLWDSVTFQEIPNGTLSGHTNGVHTAYFSKNEKYIVTASKDNTVKVWKWNDTINSYKEDKNGTLDAHTGFVNMAKFSPDDKHIITASADGTVRIWSAETHKQEYVFPKFNSTVESVEYGSNPDGTAIILTAEYNGTISLWDANSYDPFEKGIVKDQSTGRSYASFCSNGRKIVVASWDGYAKVFEWNDNNKAYEPAAGGYLDNHNANVSTAVFSPKKGEYILISSWDNTAKIWDSTNYNLVDTISYYPGLEIWGIDLTKLRNPEDLSENARLILDRYGAKTCVIKKKYTRSLKK